MISGPMNRDKFYTILQFSVMGTIAALLAYRGFQTSRNREAPSVYFLAIDSLRDNPRIKGISRVVGPSGIRFERVSNNLTNVWGWVETTNKSGMVRTQWFRCLVDARNAKHPRVTSVEMTRHDPLHPTTSNEAP